MGGQVGSEVEPVSGLFQDWILLGLSELGDSVKTVERSLMEAASNHLENSSHRLGGGVFDSIVFALEQSWQPFSMGGSGPTMQMYYNESRGYPEADVDEECACSEPVILTLSGPRSWKPQSQDMVLPGLLG